MRPMAQGPALSKLFEAEWGSGVAEKIAEAAASHGSMR